VIGDKPLATERQRKNGSAIRQRIGRHWRNARPSIRLPTPIPEFGFGIPINTSDLKKLRALLASITPDVRFAPKKRACAVQLAMSALGQ